MGLHVHSLAEIPIEAKRGYYLYILDYGWEEPLGNVIEKNFNKIAGLASRNDAVVVRGEKGVHFEDEVLSWHHVNGAPSEELLPAILISNIHPRHFRDQYAGGGSDTLTAGDKLILIPLRKLCTTPDDVVRLLERLFKDIKNKKQLCEFEVLREMKRGKDRAILDALILKPSIAGLGIDLNYIADYFTGKRK